jgi:hypothetical protein
LLDVSFAVEIVSGQPFSFFATILDQDGMVYADDNISTAEVLFDGA